MIFNVKFTIVDAEGEHTTLWKHDVPLGKVEELVAKTREETKAKGGYFYEVDLLLNHLWYNGTPTQQDLRNSFLGHLA